MTKLLIKLFIKNHEDITNPFVREKYGLLTSVMGLIINLLLFAGKFIIGSVAMSISIQADAINNLSDAGSSIISLVSFKISSKPADRQHPFGHARIEYIASMIVSFTILFICVELFKTSIHKIINPSNTIFSITFVIVLLISILAKLWLLLFYGKVGKMLRSTIMRAVAADSMSDVLSTSAVLISMIIMRITSVNTDGYMGVAVAIIILISAIKILNETKNHILGSAPDPEMIENIQNITKAYCEIIGIHDLVIHNYGPGRCFASLHAEVDGSKDIFISHDVIDNIEENIKSKLGIDCVVHLDPIVTNNEKIDHIRSIVTSVVCKIDRNLSIHDFRFVEGNAHSKLIFDILVPFECKIDKEALRQNIDQELKQINSTYTTVITFDRG